MKEAGIQGNLGITAKPSFPNNSFNHMNAININSAQ